MESESLSVDTPKDLEYVRKIWDRQEHIDMEAGSVNVLIAPTKYGSLITRLGIIGLIHVSVINGSKSNGRVDLICDTIFCQNSKVYLRIESVGDDK